MGIASKAAARYARAFLSWVQRQAALDPVREDIAGLAREVATSPELRGFLRHYLIPRHTRQAALRALFEERLHPATLRLILFLESKKRLGLLAEVLAAYQQQDEALRRVVRGQVVAAGPVDSDLARRISDWVARQVPGAELRLDYREDAALIGGLTICVNDNLWDGSVAGALRRLRRQWADSRLD